MAVNHTGAGEEEEGVKPRKNMTSSPKRPDVLHRHDRVEEREWAAENSGENGN